MRIRFLKDADTGMPHIFAHGVTEEEVEQVLRGHGEVLAAGKGAEMKLGQTIAGRYLQVVYVWEEERDGLFVLTAYPLQGRPKRSFRRRQRR